MSLFDKDTSRSFVLGNPALIALIALRGLYE